MLSETISIQKPNLRMTKGVIIAVDSTENAKLIKNS